MNGLDLPERVTVAYARADAAGFTLSCAPGFGRFLAALAAAVPESGRILELGTGAGAGLAWIVEGLGPRTDAEVVTVDIDAEVQRTTEEAGWPAFIHFEVGDGAEAVERSGVFDLVFADAPGGKLVNLDGTVAALAPGGVLVVDDMDLGLHGDPQLREVLARAARRIHGHPDLVAADVPVTTGAILAVKRRCS